MGTSQVNWSSQAIQVFSQFCQPGSIQNHRKDFVNIDPLAPLKVYEEGTNTLDSMF